MKEVLDKILAILEAQDAKIKALEAELKVYSEGTDTLIDTIYEDKDSQWYNEFSGKHRAKFEPYLGLMDKLEGGDAFRVIYDKTKDLSGTDGYEEDAYIESVLANVIEMIESLKAVTPPEAQPALEEAQEAIVEASIEAQTEEKPADQEIIEEKGDAAPDEWTEDDLAKEKLEGHRLFE